MKYLVNYLSKILRNELPKPLGRWKIDYCDTKTNNRIDLSNEDNCGTCGQYAKTKLDLQNNFTTLVKIHNITPKYATIDYVDPLELECIEELKKYNLSFHKYNITQKYSEKVLCK